MTNKGHFERVVWDAAYHSPTYCGIEKGGKLVCPEIVPVHAAMVGSLNKLTDINGLRVGWLATDSCCIYDSAKYYVESDLCEVSGPSQEYATRILQRFDLHAFYCESKRLLDNNREELQRLSYMFGGQPIFPYGMFSLFEVDDGIRSLFRRASVKFKDGDEIGDKERDSVRINLANSNEATRVMVEAILKADNA
jgi:aspartate/methionine/tyrosine aminotransferase